MQIFVKNLKGINLSLEVNSKDTIYDIKTKIFLKENI